MRATSRLPLSALALAPLLAGGRGSPRGLAPSPREQSPLDLPDAAGRRIRLADLAAGGRAVLVFHREDRPTPEQLSFRIR